MTSRGLVGAFFRVVDELREESPDSFEGRATMASFEYGRFRMVGL